MITIKDFDFSYDSDKYILKDINLNLNKGKIYTLLGKNGSGKTTLLNCISKNYIDTEDKIKVKDKLIFVNDKPVLFDYLSGKEYLELIISFSNYKNLSDFDSLIDELDLRKYLEQDIAEYSLGTKHKIALLTAFILDYNIILIDEPLRSLDLYASNVIKKFLIKLKEQGKLIIISTNIMHAAYEISDEILLLNDTKIINKQNKYNSFEEFYSSIGETLG